MLVQPSLNLNAAYEWDQNCCTRQIVVEVKKLRKHVNIPRLETSLSYVKPGLSSFPPPVEARATNARVEVHVPFRARRTPDQQRALEAGQVVVHNLGARRTPHSTLQRLPEVLHAHHGIRVRARA